MFKVFVIGVFLGLAGTIAAANFVPVVDQYREASIISVSPNGGNTESFHIKIPMDRILVGVPGQSSPLPPGLIWPEDAYFEGLTAELFKIRNARNAVVGVASRVATKAAEDDDSIEWVIHLPARGSVYVLMQPEVVEGAYRIGQLRSGTREFDSMHGGLVERWVADTSDDEDAPAGRIELEMRFVASLSLEDYE